MQEYETGQAWGMVAAQEMLVLLLLLLSWCSWSPPSLVCGVGGLSDFGHVVVLQASLAWGQMMSSR